MDLRPPLKLENYKASALKAKMQFAQALLQWSQRWIGEVMDFTPESALDALAHAKKVRRTASAVERSLEDAAIAELIHSGADHYSGPDYEAVLHPARERKRWKNDAVMEDLIDSTLERLSRRFPYVPRPVLGAIVRESMWEVHKNGRIEWRSTDLRRAGLDPDNYSQKVSDAASIDLHGPGVYPNPRRRRPRRTHQ